MSDELLVVRCQLGERDAFAELVRAWHGAVERYVGRMLAGPASYSTSRPRSRASIATRACTPPAS
jgi:hypothetical protein